MKLVRLSNFIFPINLSSIKIFDLTHTIKSNATFRTYTDAQYEEMSETRTFYEVKTFRLLGSSYIKMITNDRFDIASLIPAEMVDIGVTCLKNKDDTILGHVNIRFNTYLDLL